MKVWSTALAASMTLFAAIAGVGVTPAMAQAKFDKPIKLLVGFAPGGTADIIARVVAEKMTTSIGQPVVVENRPGAIGRITADAVKAAAPDGTTIMVMPIGPMAVVPHVYKDISYDPIKDFTPIALGATFQFAIAAGPASGAKTWAEFVTWAKANPSKAGYATSGAGSLPHFFGVLLGRGIGVEMIHVPYKGSAAYLNDLLGGQVPAAIDAIADLSELHRAGKVKVLASSGAKNDYVLALWLVCAVCFAGLAAQGQRLRDALCLGAAVGLAMLTKATAYLFLPWLRGRILPTLQRFAVGQSPVSAQGRRAGGLGTHSRYPRADIRAARGNPGSAGVQLRDQSDWRGPRVRRRPGEGEVGQVSQCCRNRSYHRVLRLLDQSPAHQYFGLMPAASLPGGYNKMIPA